VCGSGLKSMPKFLGSPFVISVMVEVSSVCLGLLSPIIITHFEENGWGTTQNFTFLSIIFVIWLKFDTFN